MAALSSPLRILFLAAEAVPLIKVGGLADVAGALPKALRALGHDVRVALPLHPAMRELVAGQRSVASFRLEAQGAPQDAIVFRHQVDGVDYYLVDGPPLRSADAIYHSQVEQDAQKFVFFSLAALGLARALDWKPDLVHANDWHTGAAVYWLQTTGRSDPFFAPVATLITVHNLPYLGDGAGDALREFDLLEEGEENTPPRAWLPEWARDALLPLALAYADIITTVSPTYAEEIRTPEFGCGLASLLQARRKRLRGILNGLDTKQWDPAHDPALESSFDSNHLERRARNKQALLQQWNLAQTRAPLLGVVSRLDYQKGLDLALPALARWVEEGGQAIIVGTGDPGLERQYRELSERNPTQVAVALGYNAKLASRIYAGADLLLMPSRYEPCGLSQMIAMRYGCIPVVRSVGGLRDTVRDVESGRGTGFVFSGVNGEGMTEALKRARAVFEQPRRWQVIQRRAMRQDFSWGKSARAYLAAYRRAMTLHNSRAIVRYRSGVALERSRS